MDVWSGFYERIANFREIRYFDIEGKLDVYKRQVHVCAQAGDQSPGREVRTPCQE